MSITNLQIGDSAETVTPNDSTVLVPGILYIGTGGDVNVTTVAGETKVFKNVPDGSTLYAIMVTKVLSTSTTADDILILR